MSQIRSLRSFFMSTITVAALGACHSAVAQVVRTEYHGQESLIDQISPGKQWVTADQVLHIRNGQLLFFDQASDPRVTGEVVVSVNANFKLAPPPVLFYGPMNGTFQLTNGGGSWVGTWTGIRNVQGHSSIKGVAKGQGGYEGLQSRFTYTRNTPDPSVPFELHGVILELPK